MYVILGGDTGIGQSWPQSSPKEKEKKGGSLAKGREQNQYSKNLIYFCASDLLIPVSHVYQALGSPPLPGSQEYQVQSRQSLASIYQEVWRRGWPASGSDTS